MASFAKCDQLCAVLDGTRELSAQMLDTAAAKVFMEKQRQAILSMLCDIKVLSFEVASKLAAKVIEMSWEKDQKEPLLKAISEKASLQDLPSAHEVIHVSGRRPNQDFTALPAYVLPSMWSVLKQTQFPKMARIELLSKFAAQLGLQCPTESTIAAMQSHH